jgi:hypothetical protein
LECLSRLNCKRPAFLITIDTEGDDLWSKPREISTRNSQYLPRFQGLCEKYGLKPTYLTDWEMVACPIFEEFAPDILHRNVGEIGMHLHAWNTPPLLPLTEDDFQYQPYIIEYPPTQMRDKVRFLTEALEQKFQVKMRSHRSGRWSFNGLYAQVLLEQGYHVDCSIAPHTSYRKHLGHPLGEGGTDYTNFPEQAYFIDVSDISRPGTSDLLEIPLTVVPNSYPAPVESVKRGLEKLPVARRVARRFFPPYLTLRPNGRNRRWMKKIIDICLRSGSDYVEFMLHSSEFMPGGSPTFRTEASIEALYDDIEQVFAHAGRHFIGCTLDEYYHNYGPLAAGAAMRRSHQCEADARRLSGPTHLL